MRRWALLILLATLIFDVWLRGHTFGPTLRDRWGINLWPVSGPEAEPLDCDESVYAYAGRRILRGDVMYRDLTEPKPPGGYWLGAATVALGGADELPFRLMPIPFVLGTIALTWWMGLKLQGPLAACFAGVTYAVASTDPYLFGNGSNLEHPINFLAFASLALLIAAWTSEKRRLLFAAGASVGAACLFKQVAMVHYFLYMGALCLRPREIRARLKDMVALSCGLAFVFGIVAFILVLQGAGSAALEDVVRYGAAMAKDVPADPGAPPSWMRWLTGNADPQGNLPWPFGRTDYLVWWGTGSWPLWLVALPALALLGIPRSSSAPRRLLAAWTLSAFIQVVLPGLYWQHYYLLPLPGLAVAVAVSWGDALSQIRKLNARSVLATLWMLSLGLSLVAVAVIQTRVYLLVAPEKLTIDYKGGRQWVSLRFLGRDLEQRATVWSDPRLFLWGWQSPLFVYSGIDSVSRHFFADPLMKAFAEKGHPLIQPRIDRIMQDLEKRPPEMVFAGDPPFPAMRRFLNERYLPSRLVPMASDGRGLWVERGRYRQFETFVPNRRRQGIR